MIPEHDVRIALGDASGWDWVRPASYEVSCDMLNPADAISLSFPFSSELWPLAAPDRLVNVIIDGTRVFSGIVDDRRYTLRKSEGAAIHITARDKIGRLIDESAPLIRFRSLGILDLGRKLAGHAFEIVLSNAENRRLIVGPKLKHHSREPAIARFVQGAHRKVEPGESIWQVLSYFLEEAALLAWSTADGTQLVIGKPNYSQQAQWLFVAAASGSQRKFDANILEVDYQQSLAERYSQITVMGAHPGEDGEPGATRRGIAVNGPGPAGIGKDFEIKKALLLKDDAIRSAAHAKDRAGREMAERDGRGTRLRIVMPGHGEVYGPGQQSALYAFDTVAHVLVEQPGIESDWYVTGVNYRGSREAGQTTEIDLVPVGTDLRMAG